jgi:hypothetical protein
MDPSPNLFVQKTRFHDDSDSDDADIETMYFRTLWDINGDGRRVGSFLPFIHSIHFMHYFLACLLMVSPYS